MKAFLLACLAVVVITGVAKYALDQTNLASAQVYSSDRSVRVN